MFTISKMFSPNIRLREGIALPGPENLPVADPAGQSGIRTIRLHDRPGVVVPVTLFAAPGTAR